MNNRITPYRLASIKPAALLRQMLLTGLALLMILLAVGCAAPTAATTPAPTTAAAPTAAGAQVPPAGMLPEGKPQNVDTSSIKQKWVDIAYASTSSTQKLDIYLPNEGTGPFPVIISIHGGGFAMGDKVGPDLTAALTGLNRGYAVVGVNYRLSSEAVFPAQINDIKAAIRFLRANASKYNLNPNKFAVWGGSAGGALAALAGTSGDVKDLQALETGNAAQSDRVQAVVDWYGPINFLTMDDQFKQSGIAGQTHNTADSFESKLMGKQITLIPELVQKANPETYITQDDPPFFIQHGSADTNIPTQQSVDFAAKLQAAIGKDKVSIEILSGAEHGGAQFTTNENIKKVLDFLDRYLK